MNLFAEYPRSGLIAKYIRMSKKDPERRAMPHPKEVIVVFEAGTAAFIKYGNIQARVLQRSRA